MTRAGLRAAHEGLLERWRKVMNLVGPGPVQVHFDDVLGAIEPLRAEGRWVDLGSGAGFPGLVLATQFPDLELDLVESRQKRSTFLSTVLAQANVQGVRVLEQRVEDLPSGAYDGVTGRAFAEPSVVFDHAARLLRPGGEVLLFLQDDEAGVGDPRFVQVWRHPYRVDGKRRRSELWKLNG